MGTEACPFCGTLERVMSNAGNRHDCKGVSLGSASRVEFAVEVRHEGQWVDLPGFRKDDEAEALEGAQVLESIGEQQVRMVKVTTTISEEVAWRSGEAHVVDGS